MTDTIRKRHEQRIAYDAALASWRTTNAPKPCLCGDCRHWRTGSDGAELGACRVSGSFRAPGGLFTQADFGCIHGVKS